MNGMDDAFTAPEQDPRPLLIGPRGQWFQLGELKVDLSRRKPLVRLLWALTQVALDGGRGLSTPELIAAGWPGEKLVKNAGRIRLRVAIATLRSMGLSRITTTRAGYTLSGTVSVDGEAPLSHERVSVSVPTSSATAGVAAAEAALAVLAERAAS